MKMDEIKAMAKARNIKTGKSGKNEVVRAIQLAEGNTPCFNTGASRECGQLSCLWREDCL